MEASTGSRVTILSPIFEGEDVADVLDVLTHSSTKKMGYHLHHVDGLTLDLKTGRFAWTCCDVEKHHRWVQVVGIDHKSSKCPPLSKSDGSERFCEFEEEYEGVY